MLASVAAPLFLTAVELTPPVASYQISCRLDPETKTVEGTQLLTWKNTTSRPAGTLQFHLYLNAFRNTLSSFWTSAGQARDKLPESWGSIEVTRMTAADGADLLPGWKYISPDDGNPHDRTVAEVSLTAPVPPGATLSVAMDFRARLPRVSNRTGYKGDFFFVAQWFPKLGVLEEKGWNCHQFHATTEFFADFGNYDVSIEVPARYRGKVGATGTRVEERDAPGGRLVYRFRQESVHDFAWTADPDFLVFRDVFREPGLPEVALTLLLQPEHKGQEERHFRAAKAGLSGYGRVMGPYPYPTLTLVDPPWGGRGAGGMEYPTLITCGTHRIAPKNVQSPEGVTIHEFGHQYFYGMLATNEFEEAWLDEGFTTYMTNRVLKSTSGADHPVLSVFGYRFPLGIEVHHPVDGNRRYFAGATKDYLAVPSWKFLDRSAFALNVYSKTAIAMATLERLLTTPVMDRALRLYFERWRFRHPSTRDWIGIVNEVAGRDWSWFFERTFFSSGVVDYAVSELTSEAAKVPRGLFEWEGKLLEKPPPSLASPRGHDSAATVVRRGDVAMPVEVVLRFAGGKSYRFAWDGEARWKRYRVSRGPKLLEALVDPDEKILLDVDRTNNGRLLIPDPRAASRWTARSLFWLQNLLDFATVAW